MRSIRDADIKGKKVFLRVDFNVTMDSGKIVDDNRIKSALPTINYLIEKEAKVIIGTHLGRPEGSWIPGLSTVPVAQHLAKLLNKKVYVSDHVISQEVTEKIETMKPGEVLILGNLRFHQEEEANNEAFAQDLAKYADLYVNDAFGVSHRANASVEAITRFLPSYSGFLLDAETTTLSLLLKEPVRPFLLIIGGAKIKDKAALLKHLVEKADKVLLGGAVGNTFLSTRGFNISQSLSDKGMQDKCEEIMELYGNKLVLPVDTVRENLEDGSYKMLDIGPKTIEKYKNEIKSASTIFWNGNLGYTEDENFAKGTMEIAKAIAENPNTKVVAGGDTVTFIEKNNLAGSFTFISTGGGAAMQYLSGEELPGVTALDKSMTKE